MTKLMRTTFNNLHEDRKKMGKKKKDRTEIGIFPVYSSFEK